MAQLKVKDIRKVRVGQWVRTKWDDCGNLDCIIIEKTATLMGRKNGKQVEIRECKGFFPSDKTTCRFQDDQIVAIGKHITCKDNGL